MRLVTVDPVRSEDMENINYEIEETGREGGSEDMENINYEIEETGRERGDVCVCMCSAHFSPSFTLAFFIL